MDFVSLLICLFFFLSLYLSFFLSFLFLSVFLPFSKLKVETQSEKEIESVWNMIVLTSHQLCFINWAIKQGERGRKREREGEGEGGEGERER